MLLFILSYMYVCCLFFIGLLIMYFCFFPSFLAFLERERLRGKMREEEKKKEKGHGKGCIQSSGTENSTQSIMYEKFLSIKVE